MTVSRKVSFRVVLFYRAEGTSAKMPLARPEKSPLASILPEARLSSILNFESFKNFD